MDCRVCHQTHFLTYHCTHHAFSVEPVPRTTAEPATEPAPKTITDLINDATKKVDDIRSKYQCAYAQSETEFKAIDKTATEKEERFRRYTNTQKLLSSTPHAENIQGIIENAWKAYTKSVELNDKQRERYFKASKYADAVLLELNSAERELKSLKQQKE